MLTPTFVHPEGPRYGTSIVYLAGLWTGASLWRPVASFLAHRGWPGALLDVRGVAGGLAARADAVAGWVRGLPAPPVLIGHDAGALVALGAAGRVPVRALVLVSALVPGAPGTHSLVWSRGLPWALVRRAPVAPPGGAVGAAFFAGLADDARAAAGPEDPRVLAALARRSGVERPATGPPALVLRGAADPVVSSDDARALAAAVGADLDEVPAGGHWLPVAPGWQDCVHRVHRWLVRHLAEHELDFYAEAVADAEDADPGRGGNQSR